MKKHWSNGVLIERVEDGREIDFEDPDCKLLLKMCRNFSAKSEFKECEDCRIKFKCFTFKSKEDFQES